MLLSVKVLKRDLLKGGEEYKNVSLLLKVK